jgi:hypothetical protein
MSEYVYKSFPRWMFHEVLPDRIAENEAEAQRLEDQGYTRDKLVGRDALTARLKYHRAEVALLEAQLAALGGPAEPQEPSEPAPISDETAPEPSPAAPAPPVKKRSGWPKGKKRWSKEK